jgi:hypothetical protein
MGRFDVHALLFVAASAPRWTAGLPTSASSGGAPEAGASSSTACSICYAIWTSTMGATGAMDFA